ncbi:MAG: endolytic transglycosylase MltG [Patescibacteria group bacterium]
MDNTELEKEENAESLDFDKNQGLKKNNILYKMLFFSLSGIVLFLIIFYLSFVQAPANFRVGEIVTIEEGESLRSVSLKLKEQNFIKSRIAFESFVIIYGGEKHIIPGDYLFEKKYSVSEIAYRISKGDRRLSMVKITIPEGFDLEEISEICSLKLENFSKSKFLELAKNDEGYLFPDTYFFDSTDNEKDVYSFMKKNFDKKTTNILKEIQDKGMDKEDIIIMASILEKEAKGDADREIISGILWKRLSIGMALQVDAAPITYKERGLPKSPISNPGILAIRAAMYPEASSYLYYLHNQEGEIYFAKTFDEHRQNKKKYLR